MVGGTQPCEYSQDHAHMGEGPKLREVQMELSGGPKVRAGVVSDGEEEEEFNDSREH